jgi:spore coat polysaccharide biosynthesis protein SpsF
MAKIIAITQARTGSTRTPNKIFRQIGNKSILEIHIDRLKASQKLDKFIVATTWEQADDKIIDLAQKCNVGFSRGSEHDVLDRFYQAAIVENPDYIVRLTSDCPLIDSTLIDKIIEFVQVHQCDYASNMLIPSYPDGQCIEIFSFKALEKAWNEAKLPSEREHVTPFIYNNKVKFKVLNFTENYSYGHLRMTVDYEEDIKVIEYLVSKLGYSATWLDYTTELMKSPEILSINQKYYRNHKYKDQIKQENWLT